MPEFPIQYSQGSITSQSGSVRGKPDLRTGASDIANALVGFAGTLEKIQSVQDEAELSTMRRTYQEKSYAAFNIYSQTGDPEER